MEKFKVHLIANEYSQQKGIDYDDNFSLVVKHSSFRALLSLLTTQDMHLEQMNVKTSFLQGNLDEQIYMEEPEDFNNIGHSRPICKLKRSLYGLK